MNQRYESQSKLWTHKTRQATGNSPTSPPQADAEGEAPTALPVEGATRAPLIELSNFLSALRHAVALFDMNGELIHMNAPFTSLFVRELQDGSRQFETIFKSNSVLLETYKKIKETGGSFYLRDSEILLEFKAPRLMDVELFSILEKGSQVAGYGVLLRDRVDHIRLEAHQKRMERVEYLAQIASGLAHEIKNPLSGIKGVGQLLSQELSHNPELKNLAHIVEKEADRVNALVTDLLHFTKPRVLQKSSVNLNKVLHDTMMLQKIGGSKKVRFYEEFDPSLPSLVADESALRQVFLNFIKNSYEAIKESGEIKVTTRIVTDFGMITNDKKRMVVRVDIADTGVGMTNEVLQKIFTPFFTTKSEGTGLGLSLCQQIIEEHEGHLEIKSEVGHGSTISIYLPV